MPIQLAGTKLAIAAMSLDKPSETFIRDHIRMIAPGETIILCQNSRGSEQFGYPVLCDVGGGWQLGNSLVARYSNAVRRYWRRNLHPELSSQERRRVRTFFETHLPRAVLAEYGVMGCALVQVCEDASVPFYVHFHGYDASKLLRRARWRRRYAKLFRSAAGIIAPSRFLADNLRAAGCPESKLHVSPCGVDPLRFTPARRNGAQRLLAVGRLVEKKAPHLTIAAFGRIAARFPEATLDIVGDGPEAARCRALINPLGLEGRVHMHGSRTPDFVARLMQECSIFVQHSITSSNGDTEGLPVAILEAMASEMAVVATRHSGIPEAVEDGVTGLLVVEHDVEAMALAIANLLDDPARAAAMGIAGRKRVLQNFTLERSRDRLRAIMGFAPLAAIPLATAEAS